jgi:isopenicillin-N N-acyltransferase-like protein
MHFVEARGSASAIGEAQGEALKDPIRELLERLERDASRVQGVPAPQVLQLIAPYAGIMEAQLPHLAEEARGVARAAGIQYLQAQLLNYQGEARLRRIEGCTSFAVASSDRRRVVVGQNVDMPALFVGMNRVMHVTPLNGPAFVMWGFVGCVGQRGVNTAGLALMGNGLGGPAWRPGVSSSVTDRAALECLSIEEALARLRGLTRAKSTNMMMVDVAGRIVDVESTATDDRTLVADAALGHANSYVHEDFAPISHDLDSLEDSKDRQRRADSLLGGINRGGDLVTVCRSLLSDHEGHPRSICRHDRTPETGYLTTASLIALLPERVLLAADGPPCEQAYVEYHA